MTMARKEVVVDGEERTYHCISRCVRRAFLCGRDEYSGKDYEHRKDWVRDRLRKLAGIFAVDVCGYAVLSNHTHTIVRTRPDLAKDWSKNEVALRWWRLFPRRREKDGTPAEPTATELGNTLLNKEGGNRTEKLRQRLGSVSWFMRCLNEWLAKRANEEDKCTGHFWQSRFQCQALLDDAALLACAAYVDLNPIRAGLAKSVRGSDHTSAQDRVCAKEGRAKTKAFRVDMKRKALTSKQRLAYSAAMSDSHRDDWLCPVGGEDSERRGFLSGLTVDEYLELLDWTGRMLRSDKRGVIPEGVPQVLSQVDMSVEQWLRMVRNYGNWYYRFVGALEKLMEKASELGRSWLRGVGPTKQHLTSSTESG